MRFGTGLVVGKFSPLHLGHQYLIDHALAACDHLVIVSYAKPELGGCDSDKRRGWLHQLYPQATILIVDDDWLARRAAAGMINRFCYVPTNKADEGVHRHFTAWLCREALGLTVDAVFTSEDYGDGFAAVLTEEFGTPVAHVCVDRSRAAVPISASTIRVDRSLRSQWLAAPVRASLVPRVLLLGAESTGKTSLSSALAERWSEPCAAEYGRELWMERSGRLAFEDLLHIGEEQLAREDRLALTADRFLVCDTSPLTTLFYSHAMFGRADERLVSLAERRYTLTFLCLPDIPLQDDGTRQDEEFRSRQHRWYVDQLDDRGWPYVSLGGGHAQRLATAETALMSSPAFDPS